MALFSKAPTSSTTNRLPSNSYVLHQLLCPAQLANLLGYCRNPARVMLLSYEMSIVHTRSSSDAVSVHAPTLPHLSRRVYSTSRTAFTLPSICMAILTAFWRVFVSPADVSLPLSLLHLLRKYLLTRVFSRHSKRLLLWPGRITQYSRNRLAWAEFGRFVRSLPSSILHQDCCDGCKANGIPIFPCPFFYSR